jgi:hypothetical protein
MKIDGKTDLVLMKKSYVACGTAPFLLDNLSARFPKKWIRRIGVFLSFRWPTVVIFRSRMVSAYLKIQADCLMTDWVNNDRLVRGSIGSILVEKNKKGLNGRCPRVDTP